MNAAKAQMVQAELSANGRVYSPIDGIAGVANSQIGDLVGTTTKMTTVSQVDPIWAYFNIPESAYLANAEAINRAIRSGNRQEVPRSVAFIQANGELPGERRNHFRESTDRLTDRHHPDGRRFPQ